MIRFTHHSGSLAGTTSTSDKRWLRVGTGHDCELRFDPALEPKIAPYHAAIVLKDGVYHLLDLDSPTGMRVNGQKVAKAELRSGDRIRFGGAKGPEVEIEIVLDASYDPAQDAAEIAQALQAVSKESATGQILAATALRIAEERMKAGGTRSRKTMGHIATAVHEVSEAMKLQTRKRWVKVVGAVSAAALVIITVLGVVIWVQQRRIDDLLDAKSRFDSQIRLIQQQMQREQNPARLAVLERELLDASANAEQTLAQLARASRERAAAAANTGDELDREIREILKQFDAETYAVPPILKERVQFYLARMQKSYIATRETYARKVQYWPVIARELRALELPEAMGYLAWAESDFKPRAKSRAGAAGMWQMMAVTARQYGLRVDGRVDERLDPAKQTRAAARHLANLLSEFGEDEFMLAMASYNRGENGVRAVLHQIAQTPGGWKREKRDFWHLYRLKLLPEETREYVPKVLAAAIMCSSPERYGLVGGTKEAAAAVSSR